MPVRAFLTTRILYATRGARPPVISTLQVVAMVRQAHPSPSRFIPADSESGAPLDTASGSSPFAALRRFWDCSTARLLADEICNLPRRIQTTLSRKHLRFGYSLPLYPTFDSKESEGQGYAFLTACSEDMQKLHRDNPWAGCLDLELAGAAYQAGTQWAIHFFRRQATSTVSDSVSCESNAASDISSH